LGIGIAIPKEISVATKRSVASLRAQLEKIQDELENAERDVEIKKLGSSAEFRAVAKEVRRLDLSPDQIVRLFTESSAGTPRKKVEPKYRHPEDPKLVWSGRGRRPKWIEALIAGGKTLKSLEISKK